MIYLRMLLIFIWLVISCVIGLVLCLAHWKDLNVDRDFARVFAWGATRASGVQVEVQGVEHLTSHQPCVYVANHQSGFDMVIFGSMYPRRTIVIGKKELLWIPFFGLFFYAAGNVLLDRQKSRKARQSLSQAVEAIQKRKASIWIFPEGTRNRLEEGLLPFKKGAFFMAVEAGIPVVPIVASSLAPILSWKRKSFRGGRVKIRVLPPISTEGLTVKDVDSLTVKTREQMLEAFHGLSESRP